MESIIQLLSLLLETSILGDMAKKEHWDTVTLRRQHSPRKLKGSLISKRLMLEVISQLLRIRTMLYGHSGEIVTGNSVRRETISTR